MNLSAFSIPIFGTISAQIVAALLAAVGVWWRNRSDRRDLANQHHRLLLQLREEIDAIEAWIKAYSLVAPSEARIKASSRARYDLDRAYARLVEAPELQRRAQRLLASASPHWIMAILALALFWPIGIAAIIFASRTRYLARAGELAPARRNSFVVQIMFWISLVAIFITVILAAV